MPDEEKSQSCSCGAAIESMLTMSHSVFICIPIYLNLFKGHAQSAICATQLSASCGYSSADAALTA